MPTTSWSPISATAKARPTTKPTRRFLPPLMRCAWIHAAISTSSSGWILGGQGSSSSWRPDFTADGADGADNGVKRKGREIYLIAPFGESFGLAALHTTI